RCRPPVRCEVPQRPLLCRILQNEFATFRFDFVIATASFSRGNSALVRSVPEHLPVSEELILIQSAKAGPINDLADGHLDSPGAQRSCLRTTMRGVFIIKRNRASGIVREALGEMPDTLFWR